MLGESALKADKYIRSLQLSTLVETELAKLSAEHLALLNSYSAGVNAYVTSSAILPIEFQLLHIGFASWTPKDSLMIFKMFSFEMSTNWHLAVIRTMVTEKMGKKWAERIVPFNDKETLADQISIIESPSGTLDKKMPDKKLKQSETPPAPRVTPVEVQPAPTNGHHLPSKPVPKPPTKLDPIPADRRGRLLKASNAWVVSGQHTSSGMPLLASDPHMKHEIPSAFYLATILYPGSEVTGGTLVGIPAVIIGRGGRVAWGFSASMLENVDVFDVKLNENKTMYYHAGAWKGVKTSVETIRVKGMESVSHTIYATHHGPIIDLSAEARSPLYS